MLCLKVWDKTEGTHLRLSILIQAVSDEKTIMIITKSSLSEELTGKEKVVTVITY